MESLKLDNNADSFSQWLTDNKYESYRLALEEEGYDDLEALTMLTDDGLLKLAERANMKAGHKLKFPRAVQKARLKLQEEDMNVATKVEMDKMNQKAKMQEEVMKVEMDTIEQQKEVEKSRAQLADIKRQRAEKDVLAKENKEDTGGASTVKDNPSLEEQDILLPENMKWHYFASHKVNIFYIVLALSLSLAAPFLIVETPYS
jgi:hypothetical protein